jgi:hypothetical protein
MLVSSLIFVALLAVAIAHFMWSIGRTWPLRDEVLLAKAVVGAPGVISMPPRLASFAVAVAVFAAGLIALSLADDTAGGPWLTAAGVLLGLIFLARGIVGYTPWFARLTPEEPFRTLDRRNYSPLCLLLGAGFLTLVIMRLT